MKKNIVFLVVVIALLFASCGNKTSRSDIDPDTGFWTGEITFAPYMFGPFDSSKDIVVKEIQRILEERYKVKVKLTNVYVEYLNYFEIINTRVAGGTAPDVWLGGGDSQITEYYDQGVIAAWDEAFFRRNAPVISSYIDKGGSRGTLDSARWWKGAKLGSGTVGKMVTLPSPPYGEFITPTGVVYRGDWLQNLGVTNPPADLNEWVALMRRFTFEDPDRNGRNDTFGFSSSMMRVVFTAFGLYSPYLASTGSGNSGWWYYRDGRVQNVDTLPENKEALALLRQLYAEGVIDPTFVATERNPSGYWAESPTFINGTIGVSAHASFDHYRMKEVMNDAGGPVAQTYWAVNGENPGFKYGPFLRGPRGESGWYLDNNYALGESYVYNKELEKNPEKLAMLLKLLDIFASDEELMMLACYGVPGVTYNLNAVGVPVMIGDNAERNAMGWAATRAIYGPNNTFNPAQNEFWYKDASRQNLVDLQKQFGGGAYMPAIAGWPASTSLYAADLYSYREETFTKIVRGELPVDYFDTTYLREYMNRGGRVLEEEANAMYREQNP